jgi:hypothetical protein
MSQVARAKKMFDDVSSSDDDSKSSAAAAAPSSTTPAQHADPYVEHAVRVPGNKAESIITSEYAEGDPAAFVPKSTSASQARPERGDEAAPADNNKNASEEVPAATMVARVEVSPPPKQASVTKSAPSNTLKESSTSRALKVSSGETPAKPVASSYSTPATVSKRPVEREEKEAEDRRRAESSVRKDAKVSATKGSRYKDREQAEDDVAFTTVANASASRSRRNQDQEYQEMNTLRSPYSTTSARKATAQQLEFSREEPQTHHTDHAVLLGSAASDEEESEEEDDFPCASYIFPRLNPALADYHWRRSAMGAVKRGEDLPPNACERGLAYLMVTDTRMAVYMGILFLSTVFVVVSIPTSQLDMAGKSCFTYWGFKDDCDSATYTYTRPVYPCSEIRSHLGAGAAFSIITLVIYVVNFTATIIAVCCLKESPHKISLTSRVVVGTVGLLTVVTQVISWAVIAGIHSSHYCLEKGVLAFGVGFGLNLTSWILNFLGVIVVVAVPSRVVNRH